MKRMPLFFSIMVLPLVAAFATLLTMTNPVAADNNTAVANQLHTPTLSVVDSLRISQLYGGGGNSGAPFTHDFVELFNQGSTAVSLDGLSLQYTSATGTGNFGATPTQMTELPNVTLQPGQYYLVQQASGSNGSPLPTPDHIDPTPINMSGSAGKLALVSDTTSLGCNGGSTPCDASQLARIIDLVGFGGANFYEGSAAAPVLNSSTSALRLEGGCQDTDDNGADFTTSNPPIPRNTASPLHSCGTAVPTIVDTTPADNAVNVALNATITITFSEPVTVTANWFALACSTSGSITGTTAPASPSDSYTITPSTPFVYDEQCSVTVLASEVSNAAGLNPAADYSFSFDTEATIGDITFVYHDLEDVVQPGESVYVVGDFNGWDTTATVLTADTNFDSFTVTVPNLANGNYAYKYVVYTDTVPTGPVYWDWLNSANRSLNVVGSETVDDYRDVAVSWANLQWPETLTTSTGVATDDIYGLIYIPNVTNIPSAGARGLQAEVGYGSSADPADWDWFPMTYWADDGSNNDEYTGVITPTAPGTFSFATRYDANAGSGNPNANWTYASLNGVPFDLAQTGELNVSFNVVPIATARAGNVGDIFAIEGQVIAVNGNWNNAPEWALQDSSGGISAFFIPSTAVTLGDTVRIVASLGSFNGQEQMVEPVEYFEIVSAGPAVDPIDYTTGQVASGISEGWLVRMEGIISNVPTSCGTAYTVRLDDGSGETQVRIEAATGIDLCALGVEDGDVVGVTGFSTEFQGTYQVKPRSLSDLQFAAEAPLVVVTNPAHNATGVLTDTIITIQFNEPVTVTANWFTIQCSQSGAVTAVSAPISPAAYTLTPDAPFVSSEMCAVTVLADQVHNSSDLYMAANHRFSFTVGTPPPVGVCGDPAIPIHFIQGDGAASPLVGNTAVIEAVVVGDYQGAGQFNGYYVQQLDSQVDGDPSTSEGLFIANTSTAVAAGDLVRVAGTVSEANNVTQLNSITSTAVCAADQTVTPSVITLPVADMSEWEAVEGMLVTFSHELYVTEHYTLGRYGEVHLSVNDRIWQPTNIAAPGAPALAQQDLNNRSRILLDDGSGVQNPASIIYPAPGLTFENTLRGKAVVENLTGVVDYRFNIYRIQPVGVVDFTETDTRPQTPDSVDGDITIASFNVLNYFTTLDTGPNICGPAQNMECRGADSATEFQRQREKILNTLLEMDADVVGLIEIENNVNDDAVIDIVQGLNAATAPGTYDYIDTGVIGDDAIKLALIYQPDAVTPVGDYAILDSSVDPIFLDNKNRPVLIQTFAENENGERITVAVNHLKSKGSDCNAQGDPDTGDGQGNCNITRTNAATAIVNYLATDPTNSGTDRFLIIGDLNSYAMEDPITVLRNAGYVDLLRHFYSDQAYTYVFDGQFGHLDHALASPGALPHVTGATAWHINADEPYVLDYNTEFKTTQQIEDLYGEEPFRSSDHDPVIVGLNLSEVVPVTPTVNITNPEDGDEFVSPDGTAVTVPVSISTTDFDIPTDGYWRLVVNGAEEESVFDYDTAVDLLPGAYTITAELYDAIDQPLNISDSVDITVVQPVVTPTVTITNPEDGDEFVSPDGTAVTVPVNISTTDFDIPADGYWRLVVNGAEVESVFDYDTTVDLLPGAHTITAELYDAIDQPLNISDSVDITVVQPVVTPTVTITNPEDGDEFTSDGTAVTVPVTIATTDFDIPADGYWRLLVNGAEEESVFDYDTAVDLLPGAYALTAELYAADDTPLGISDTVNVIVTLATSDITVTITSPEDGEEFVSPDGTAVTVPVTIATTDFDIPADGYWHLLVNGNDMGAIHGYDTTIDLLPGDYTLTAELYETDGTALGILDIVTIRVVAPVVTPTVTITSPEDGAAFVSADGTAVTVPVTIATTDFDIPTDGYWRLFANGVEIQSAFGYTATVDLLPGTHQLQAELYAADDTPLGIVDAVEVTVSTEPEPPQGYTIYLPIIIRPADSSAELAPAVDSDSVMAWWQRPSILFVN